MIRSALISTMLIALIIISGCGEPKEQAMQRAAPGDTMWVILNHVKPDKRQQFERFVEEIVKPAAEELAKSDSVWVAIMKQTRTLYPTEPNEDSTYTYIWLMDPLVSGADYGLRGLISRIYSQGKTEEHMNLFEDALDRPQEGYVVIQKREQL